MMVKKKLSETEDNMEQNRAETAENKDNRDEVAEDKETQQEQAR